MPPEEGQTNNVTITPDDQKPVEQLIKEYTEAVKSTLSEFRDELTTTNEALKAKDDEWKARFEDIQKKLTTTNAEPGDGDPPPERRGQFIPPSDVATGPTASVLQLKSALKRKPVIYRRVGLGGPGDEDSIDVVKVLDEDAWAFQKFNDVLLIGATVLSVLNKSTFADEVKGLRQPLLDYYVPTSSILRKALDTLTAGEGLEWIPTGFSADLMEIVRLMLKVGAIHSRIPMPTNPYTLPVEGADQVAFLAAQQTADPESATKISTRDFVTANITLTAIKLAVRTAWSDELDQDSIVTMGDYVRNKQAIALAAGQETAALNGDTTATHMDSNVTAGTDAQKSWDGYRDHSLNQNSTTKDAGGDALVLTDLRALRKAMGKYGVTPTDLVWVVGISAYNQILDFTEVMTLDKYGPEATVLRGELAKVDGIPIIASEYQRENLNASGVYDGVTTNRTVVNLVNRNGFIYGDRKQITADAERDITTDQIQMVTKQRLIMSRIYAATEKVCGLVYNILA